MTLLLRLEGAAFGYGRDDVISDVALQVETGEFLVHAVDFSDDDMAALADMDARVTSTEAA